MELQLKKIPNDMQNENISVDISNCDLTDSSREKTEEWKDKHAGNLL